MAYRTNQVLKQFYLPRGLHPPFPSSHFPPPPPQYFPLSLSLPPTLLRLFFLTELAAGLGISGRRLDESSGPRWHWWQATDWGANAKQVKTGISGRPQWTAIHCCWHFPPGHYRNRMPRRMVHPDLLLLLSAKFLWQSQGWSLTHGPPMSASCEPGIQAQTL